MAGMPTDIAHVRKNDHILPGYMLLDQCCLHFQEHFVVILEHIVMSSRLFRQYIMRCTIYSTTRKKVKHHI
jgi:hypothetical protein